MAITLNVGGSKKVSQNYDPQGVSLNVTAEVPNDALTDAQKIADRAHDLFDLVNGLLDEQMPNSARPPRSPATVRPTATLDVASRTDRTVTDIAATKPPAGRMATAGPGDGVTVIPTGP